jgi:hypothetical protein
VGFVFRVGGVLTIQEVGFVDFEFVGKQDDLLNAADVAAEGLEETTVT